MQVPSLLPSPTRLVPRTSDDLDIYEGYAKDDWTVVTSDTYTASGDTAVAKIDVTTAKVTSTKKNNSTVTEVKVNDEWYKIADNAEVDTLKAGNTYDFAIVGNYVVNATRPRLTLPMFWL